ncbi:hypothetical protein [Hoeflea sp. BAL378]|uniref:hypothetical protein n=1 Tax=Hoeflea sp. BAL378 TaxID=1547437 RepID=UPI001269CFB2|nr:hypothetical protein [Hoeflea sp. BAL378]
MAPDIWQIVFGSILILAAALTLPVWLNRPSAIILSTLYALVYVPAVVITVCLSESSIAEYGIQLITMTIVMCTCSVMTAVSFNGVEHGAPGKGLGIIFVLSFLAAFSILIYTYWDILGFASASDIYEQRAAGAAGNIWMGYLQTYFILVISPYIIVWGLKRKSLWLIALGSCGCVLMYMINAQKVAIILPVAIIAIYMLLSSRIPLFRTTVFHLMLLTFGVGTLLLLDRGSPKVDFALSFLVFRTIAVPALTLSQYNDLFSDFGYTLWSHVKGVNLLITPPGDLAWNPKWPSLGHILGEFVYGDATHNVNANLFSSDGAAAAGSLGILAIGCVLLAWIFMLDRFARHWDPRVTVALVFPCAFSLTNGPLFTSLLSFGGLFWLLLFALYRNRLVS